MSGEDPRFRAKDDRRASTEIVPPMNLDAEESVLGALLLNDRVIASVADATDLAAAHFYRESHGEIYKAILALYAEGEPVDAITVVAELRRTDKLKAAGGEERVHELGTLVPAASNAPHYARLVIEAARLRNVQRAARAILAATEGGASADEAVERAEALVFDLAQTGARKNDWVGMEAAVAAAHKRIREAHETGRDLLGLPSGYERIDRLTSGWQPGNLIILAARPSVGKTSLALGCAVNAAVFEEQPVGIFTREMSVSELTERMLSSLSHVDATAVRAGKLDGEGWERLNTAAGKLERAPVWIDDSAASMVEVRTKARRLKLRQPALALLVVDYLQLLDYGGDGRYEGRERDVSKISRALKTLAGELAIPVLALSQLSRNVEQRHDKRPMLSDLRESGSLEQDADLVLFIYRDEYYNPEDTDQHGIAEVNVAKQRNGPTGLAKLAWSARHARFSNLAPER